MMEKLELTTGQSVNEKKFFESIQKKNRERERLPRGRYVVKSI